MTDSDLVERLEKRANELHPVFDVHERQLLREAATALRTQPSERKPDFWAVHKPDGYHVGLWADEATAREVASDPDYADVVVVTPLYVSPPAGEGVTDAMVERAARVLVPVWYGGFEDQTQNNAGGWLWPPGTPNQRARDTARRALLAALNTGGSNG